MTLHRQQPQETQVGQVKKGVNQAQLYVLYDEADIPIDDGTKYPSTHLKVTKSLDTK